MTQSDEDRELLELLKPRCQSVMCPQNVLKPEVCQQARRAIPECPASEPCGASPVAHGGVADEEVEAEEQVLVPVVQRDAKLRKIVQEVPQRSGCSLRLLLVMNGVSRRRCRGNLCMLIQE